MSDNIDSDGLEDAEELIDIHFAIINNEEKKLDELCKKIKNLNGKFMDDLDPLHLNMTPLALSCALNKINLVKILLKNGANIDATFANLKTTSLMTSSFHGHVDIVDLLLSNGASVNLLDVQKSSALGYCFGGTKNQDIVKKLIDNGIDINSTNMLGMNALLLVSGYGNPDLLTLVLRARSKVNKIKNNFGHTPLHLAVLGKNSQISMITKKGLLLTGKFGINRRGIDKLMMEWAGNNREIHLENCKLDERFQQASHIMKMLAEEEDEGMRFSVSPELLTDEEIIKHKLDMASKTRKKIINNSSSTTSGLSNDRKPSILNSLFSCGGKIRRNKSLKSKSIKKPSNPPSHPEEEREKGGKIWKGHVGYLDEEGEEKVDIICENFLNTIKLLLKSGCDVNEDEFTYGLKPLDLAILNGDIESTCLILSHSPSLSPSSSSSSSSSSFFSDPCHVWRTLGMKELYFLLSESKLNKKEIKDEIEKDKYININDSFSNCHIPTRLSETMDNEMMGDSGLTPLAVVAKGNDPLAPEIIKMFIKHGARIDEIGKGGRTALGEGCRWGNLATIETLLDQGASLELENPAFRDATPLLVSVSYKQSAVVDLLLSRGANMEKKMADGRGCLVEAMDELNIPLVEKLLQADLENNFQEKNSFEYNLCSVYQSKKQNIKTILDEIAKKTTEIKEREEQEKRERQIEIETETKNNMEFSKQKYPIYEQIEIGGVQDEVKKKQKNKKVKKKKKKNKTKEEEEEEEDEEEDRERDEREIEKEKEREREEEREREKKIERERDIEREREIERESEEERERERERKDQLPIYSQVNKINKYKNNNNLKKEKNENKEEEEKEENRERRRELENNNNDIYVNNNEYEKNKKNNQDGYHGNKEIEKISKITESVEIKEEKPKQKKKKIKKKIIHDNEGES